MGLSQSSSNLNDFQKLPQASRNVILLSVFVAVMLAIGAKYGVSPFPTLGIDGMNPSRAGWERFTFLCYLGSFAAMWIVYFSSRSKLWFLHVRTLRVLLDKTSLNWKSPKTRIINAKEHPLELDTDDIDEDNLQEVEGYFQDKARSSLQSMGMLLAVATLELGQINLMQHWVSEKIASNPAAEDAWDDWTLGAATLCAMSSFIMFVVSTDSLDSLFNRFQGIEDRHKLIDYFYRNSINPRYFGLVLLLLGATMIIAHRDPLLGATSIGLIFFFGYRVWFPTIVDEGDFGHGRILKISNVTKLLFFLVPLVMHFW